MKDRKHIALLAAAGTAVVVGGALLLRMRRQRRATQILEEIDQSPPTSKAEDNKTQEVSSNTQEPVEREAAEQMAQAQRAKERGNKRFQGQQYELAIEEYTRAIELSPESTDPDVAKFYGNRAQCYISLGRHELAETDCSAALAIDPKYVKAICRRANAREQQGKKEEALADFTGACFLSDMNHTVGIAGIERLVKEIAQEKAEKRLQEPMCCLPSPFFISTFVDSFRDHREQLARSRAPTRELTASLAKASTGCARALLLADRAFAYMKENNYETAMQDWAAAAALIPPADSSSGSANDEQQQTLAAWQEAAKEDESKTSPGSALSMLGMFLHLRGNYDDAMKAYDYALALQPNTVEVLLKRSSLWFEKEQLTEAFADFDTALAADSSHPDIYCHRGQLLMLQNRLSDALVDLRKAIDLDENSVLAHIQLGMALHRQNKPTEARKIFEQAEARFPTSPDVLNYHGELLVEAEDHALATKKFEKALEASGGRFALAHVNLGVLKLHASKDMTGAIEQCRKAIEVDPLCETAHMHLAGLLLQQSNLGEAVDAYDKAVSLLRVKQELVECYSMREAAAAQLVLLREQRDVYEPAIERQRERAAAAMGAS